MASIITDQIEIDRTGECKIVKTVIYKSVEEKLDAVKLSKK